MAQIQPATQHTQALAAAYNGIDEHLQRAMGMIRGAMHHSHAQLHNAMTDKDAQLLRWQQQYREAQFGREEQEAICSGLLVRNAELEKEVAELEKEVVQLRLPSEQAQQAQQAGASGSAMTLQPSQSPLLSAITAPPENNSLPNRRKSPRRILPKVTECDEEEAYLGPSRKLGISEGSRGSGRSSRKGK